MRRPASTALLMLLAAIATSSCGDSGSSPPPPPPPPPQSVAEAITAADKSGALPALNRDSTVAGPDADANGIRDDLDSYVAALPDTAPQKAALRQAAVAIQKSLTVDTTDQSALLAVSRQIASSSACMYSRYDVALARKKNLEIEKLTVNTKARFQAYQNFNKAPDQQDGSAHRGGWLIL